MNFKYMAFSVCFSINEGESNDEVAKRAWEAVFNAVDYDDVASLDLYGGILENETKERAYVCAFVDGKFKQMRALFKKLDNNATLKGMLLKDAPYLQQNVLRPIETLAYFGRMESTLINGDTAFPIALRR